MRIEWKSPEDRARVWNGYRQAQRQRKTLQRDRYNVILLLGGGGPQGEELRREQIAAVVGRSRQFVDQWARRYRRGGFEAITPGKARGQISQAYTPAGPTSQSPPRRRTHRPGRRLHAARHQHRSDHQRAV